MKKLSKEEKACIKSYVKMAFVKGWYKPIEIDVTRMLDVPKTLEQRTMVEVLINIEWQKLEDN